jgi:hypothetical protein
VRGIPDKVSTREELIAHYDRIFKQAAEDQKAIERRRSLVLNSASAEPGEWHARGFSVGKAAKHERLGQRLP